MTDKTTTTVGDAALDLARFSSAQSPADIAQFLYERDIMWTQFGMERSPVAPCAVKQGLKRDDRFGQTSDGKFYIRQEEHPDA